MKLSLNIMIVAILLALAFWICIPYFIDKPEDTNNISFHERSIRYSGLPPIGRMVFNILSIIVFMGTLALFLYMYKLDKSLTCENDIIRLRKYCNIYQYFLFVAGGISITGIFLGIYGLSTIPYINYSHIAHSHMMDNSVGLLISVWFFFLTHRYIKSINIASPTVILEAKQKQRNK
jgi:hypothetical protein